MIHSFCVEVAKEYSVDKAILLHNFYFWVKENQANKRNIYNGKAYTYNTSEALAELFPYLKPRKIAELLREMEYDGLIESIQNKGTNRVKSYTLTDKGMSFYTSVHESLMLQKEGVPSYENPTMEPTKVRLCTITDNKRTDIKHTDNNKTTIPAVAGVIDEQEHQKVSESESSSDNLSLFSGDTVSHKQASLFKASELMNSQDTLSSRNTSVNPTSSDKKTGSDKTTSSDQSVNSDITSSSPISCSNETKTSRVSRKSNVTEKKEKTPAKRKKSPETLKEPEFYKEIYDKYVSVFFQHFTGIPLSGKYKQFTDKCILRYRELGYSDDQIKNFILQAIDKSINEKYLVDKRIPFAMIVSESIMPRLVGESSSKPSFGVDFNTQSYDEEF